ncbi:neuromedin-U receptor 1 [Narcine bancroftii]|uniref:neuromedin-U receptor 1 n=1 Tax=Narcine bancroftii TaxID=1343680 RepID=UPI00383203DE
MQLPLTEGFVPNCMGLDLPENGTRILQSVYQSLCNGTFPQQNLSSRQEEEEAAGGEAAAAVSRGEYLLFTLGPRTWEFFTPACVTYLCIFLVGSVGNALTCFVIAKHKVMRTPTNYYLFSLASSDLLVLVVGMPMEMYEMWRNYPFLFGQFGCYFKTFLFETVCFASVLNVTALSVERYIAVVHPLKAKCIVTRTHAKRVLLGVWALSLCLAVPNTSLHGIHYLKTRSGELIEESALCVMLKPIWVYNLIIQITTVLFYFLPMITLSVLYLLIALQLKQEKSLSKFKPDSGTGNAQPARNRQDKAKNRQVTKMLFILVVVFGICWAPFHTDRLMWIQATYGNTQLLMLYQFVHVVSGVFFYFSSAVNPILYNLMSTRFREMFKEVMCRRKSRSDKPKWYLTTVTRMASHSMVLESSSGNGIPLSDIED